MYKRPYLNSVLKLASGFVMTANILKSSFDLPRCVIYSKAKFDVVYFRVRYPSGSTNFIAHVEATPAIRDLSLPVSSNFFDASS